MSINLLTTNSDWLSSATDQLKFSDTTSARLDALLMLEEVLKIDRLKLISGSSVEISDDKITALNKMLGRRLASEPMAYIIGYKEFYGRRFAVNNKVLIPRPESEVFIDLVKSTGVNNCRVADMGCGSGCLGISLKLEIPGVDVTLIDSSESALNTAKINAKKFNVKASFVRSDLFRNLNDTYEVVLANLPYLPNKMKCSDNLKYEPSVALFAGSEGLDTYKSFWDQINSLPSKPKYILCESLIDQHAKLEELAKLTGYRLIKTSVLVQLFEKFSY